MTALAPLRPMMSAASSALNRVLTGTSTAPAVSNPNAAIIHSAELGAQMATRSPFSMPSSANAPAAQRIRSTTSAKVRRKRTVDDRFRVAEAVRRAQDHLGDGLPGLPTHLALLLIGRGRPRSSQRVVTP